jgi:DNA ligase (NAD+)
LSDAEYDLLRARNAALEAAFPHLVRNTIRRRSGWAHPWRPSSRPVQPGIPKLSTPTPRTTPSLLSSRPRVRRLPDSWRKRRLYGRSRRSTGSPTNLRYERGRLVQGRHSRATAAPARTSPRTFRTRSRKIPQTLKPGRVAPRSDRGARGGLHRPRRTSKANEPDGGGRRGEHLPPTRATRRPARCASSTPRSRPSGRCASSPTPGASRARPLPRRSGRRWSASPTGASRSASCRIGWRARMCCSRPTATSRRRRPTSLRHRRVVYKVDRLVWQGAAGLRLAVAALGVARKFPGAAGAHRARGASRSGRPHRVADPGARLRR